MKYTFRVTNNGREVENLGEENYAFDSEQEAVVQGETVLDDLCPRLSPTRRFYRVEAVPVAEKAD